MSYTSLLIMQFDIRTAKDQQHPKLNLRCLPWFYRDEALTKLENIEVPSFRRICGFPCSALKRWKKEEKN